jgi:hypothetical protein
MMLSNIYLGENVFHRLPLEFRFVMFEPLLIKDGQGIILRTSTDLLVKAVRLTSSSIWPNSYTVIHCTPSFRY